MSHADRLASASYVVFQMARRVHRHTGFSVFRFTGSCDIFLDSGHAFWKSPKTMPAHLLIVDDHEAVRASVRMLFANNDSIEVCGEAQNGMEAIRMIPELCPDVVILDLSMPGMNGFETAAKIRQIAPSTKIVFFSVHEIPNTARSAGADAFISKSSTLRDLALTVTRVLQLGRNSQA